MASKRTMKTEPAYFWNRSCFPGWLAGMLGGSAGGMGRKQEDSSYDWEASLILPSSVPEGRMGIWLNVALWLDTVSQEQRLSKASACSAPGLSIQVREKGKSVEMKCSRFCGNTHIWPHEYRVRTSHIAQPSEVNKDHGVPCTRARDLINIQYEGPASPAYRHSFSRINREVLGMK